MAEYKEMCDNLSQMLECNICLSHLTRPKVLHCQHSFCKDCLDNLLQFNSDGSATITCPMRCAGKSFISASETTAQLGVNYQLVGIIDMYKEKQNKANDVGGNYSCHQCRRSDISIYCSKCNNFYCKSCQPDHNSHSQMNITYNETHNQYLPICTEHDAIANFVCCKKLVCIYCQNRSHIGHPFETLKVHANRIKQLFFDENGSGKIERTMQNANANYVDTQYAFTELKSSLVATLKNRMYTYLSKQISLVENEAARLLNNLDDIMHSHLKVYPDTRPNDFLKTVVERDDLELVARKEFILKEYSKYTTPIPTLTISLLDAIDMPSRPLGDLNVHFGEVLAIGNYEKRVSVNNKLPGTPLVDDVSILVNKLQNLMDGDTLKNEKLLDNMGLSRYSECKAIPKGDTLAISPLLQKALSNVAKGGYQYLDELFSNRQEQLIMDVIKESNEIAKLRDMTGVTILHSASQYGLCKLMSFLLKSKLVEVDAVQKYNQTALHYAAFHNKPTCIKLLLQHKCDINAKNHKGNRALDVAKQYKNAEASLLLQQADDNIDDIIE